MPRARWQVVGVILLVALGSSFFGLSAFGMYEYVNADNTEFMDNKVADAASGACQHLANGLNALPPVSPTATNAVKVKRLDHEARLIEALVTDVERLGHQALADDIPAEDWLRDWDSLAKARLAYAQELRIGAKDATMQEPQTLDHYPISRRMKDAARDSCRVVDQLRGPLRYAAVAAAIHLAMAGLNLDTWTSPGPVRTWQLSPPRRWRCC